MQTTIGILLPRSTYYETIGFEIFNGLKSALGETGLSENVRVVTENIGFGADKQQCYRSAERLLLEENATIVIAYTGQRGAQLLRPLFLAMNRLLIVLDAGANLPHEAEYCPNIIYHSLHNSLGAWLSSRKATVDGYKNGAMITGYYDGGYLHTLALTEGFTQNGGSIVFNIATGFKPETFTMDDTIKHLETNPETALLTLFCGDFLQWYFRDMVRLHGDKKLPIYLSPISLEENMLSEAVYPGDHTYGVAAWSREISTTINKQFMQVIDRVSGVKATLFHLFGWEAGLLVNNLLQLHQESGLKFTDPVLQKNIAFESPRGAVRFEEKLNTTYAPMYHAKIVRTEQNTCRLEIESTIDDIQDQLSLLTAVQLNDVVSAWYNSYVCF